MDGSDWLAKRFDQSRPHLRAVAYRMLGSAGEADDAVQETWLKVSRSDTGAVENLGGWLTTVVARVCLDMLRSRKSRREESLETREPNLIMSREAERVVECAEGPRLLMPIAYANEKWSRPFLPLRAAAISRHCLRCSTQMSWS